MSQEMFVPNTAIELAMFWLRNHYQLPVLWCFFATYYRECPEKVSSNDGVKVESENWQPSWNELVLIPYISGGIILMPRSYVELSTWMVGRLSALLISAKGRVLSCLTRLNVTARRAAWLIACMMAGASMTALTQRMLESYVVGTLKQQIAKTPVLTSTWPEKYLVDV